MDEQTKRKLEAARDRCYTEVKSKRPDLYRKAVEIGHLAMPEFSGKHCALNVEYAVMSLIRELI